MGLGPPVCVECNRMYNMSNETPPLHLKHMGSYKVTWACPNCGAVDTDYHLYDLDKNHVFVDDYRVDWSFLKNK